MCDAPYYRGRRKRPGRELIARGVLQVFMLAMVILMVNQFGRLCTLLAHTYCLICGTVEDFEDGLRCFETDLGEDTA